MKFSDDAWTLWRPKFPGVDRLHVEAEMSADFDAFKAQAGRNKEKALSLLMRDLTRDMAQTLRIDENFVLKQLINYAPRQGRSRLKKALQLARGGH